MPHKDPEARKAYARARWARLVAEDSDKVAKRKAREAAAFQRKKTEDADWYEKRKSDYQKWYAEHGKEAARERCGYMPYEEWQAICDEKRRVSREYMKVWNQTEVGQRNKTAQTIKKRCGMTIEEYDAAYDKQEGNCRICKSHRARYGKDRLVVDHCHTTGKFRALLCGPCNSAIGMLGENEETLNSAIQYLREVINQ